VVYRVTNAPRDQASACQHGFLKKQKNWNVRFFKPEHLILIDSVFIGGA
jgi:hypothetical protein